MTSRLLGLTLAAAAMALVTATAGAATSALVTAPRSLVASCHQTARTVGYRVPCPMKIPAGLTATGRNGPTMCRLSIIGPGAGKGCPTAWRGWVVGSGTTTDQHLVITASPTPLTDLAKVVNGPAWYPGERVKVLRTLTINGWHIKAVFVPQVTNDGSAFAHHVVFIWTVRGHTYGVGFHDVAGLRATLGLDEQLVRSIKLVGP